MTFIMGLNLTDRLYLAADSKVTARQKDGSVQDRGYCIKLLNFANKQNTAFMSCAIAGNKRFARFICGQIAEDCQNEKVSLDIHEFRRSIEEYLRSIIRDYPKAEGRRCQLLFAGVGQKVGEYAKPFDGEKFHKIFSAKFGEGGGRIDDGSLAGAIQLGAILNHDHRMFLVEIEGDEIVVKDGGGAYSVLVGGSKHRWQQGYKWDEIHSEGLAAYFLDKRTPEKETEDVLNFMRRGFNDVIGGAVMIEFIDARRRPIPVAYQIGKGTNPALNWSIDYQNGIWGIDSEGSRYNLLDGFYKDEPADAGLDLEI